MSMLTQRAKTMFNRVTSLPRLSSICTFYSQRTLCYDSTAGCSTLKHIRFLCACEEPEKAAAKMVGVSFNLSDGATFPEVVFRALRNCNYHQLLTVFVSSETFVQRLLCWVFESSKVVKLTHWLTDWLIGWLISVPSNLMTNYLPSLLVILAFDCWCILLYWTIETIRNSFWRKRNFISIHCANDFMNKLE